MALHRSGRAAGGLVTVAVVTAGLAASLGAGYTVARTTLTDSSAYVAKGDQVAHVNGPARSVDATSDGKPLAKDGARVITKELPDGRVVAINQKTNTVTTLDPSTLRPTSTDASGAPGAQPASVVTSGDAGWLVDWSARTVQPLVDGKTGKAIRIEGRPFDAAPGADSSLIVLTREGDVYRVGTDRSVRQLDVDPAPRGGLTVAAGDTYLVTADGGVIDVSAGAPSKITTIDGVRPPGNAAGLLLGSIEGPGDHVLVVSEGQLVILDPATGRHGPFVPLGADEDAVGEPVEFHGKVYVPDLERHKLIVVDVATKNRAKTLIPVPGQQRYFDLFVTGGRLWANDQYAQHLVELGPDGRPHQVDKGPGDGVRDDDKKTPPTNVPGSGVPGTGTPNPTGPSGGTGPGNGQGNGQGSGQGNGSGQGSGPGNGPGTGNGQGNGNGPGGRPPGTTKPGLVKVPEFADGTTYDVACAQLKDLGLECVAISREEKGAEPDVVLSVDPRSGRRVEVGSSVTVTYVGPSEVPDVPAGTPPVQACQQIIEQAGFTCAYEPATAPAPADDLAAYGTVADTTPKAGDDYDNGDPVKIRYYDSFVMPGVTGQNAAQACQGLTLTAQLPDDNGQPRTASVTCTPQDGPSAPKSNPGATGTVASQDPGGGARVPAADGATITLTQYSGKAQLDDVRGQDAGAVSTTNPVCTERFNCQIVDGAVPGDDNGPRAADLGKIYDEQDANGASIQPLPASRDVNETIRLVRYASHGAIPPVSGDVNAACQTIKRAGFACALNDVPSRAAANTVISQDKQNGDYPIGEQVTLTYSSRQAVAITKYHDTAQPSGGNVHLLSINPPGGGWQADGVFGYVYPPDGSNYQLFQQSGSCNGYQNNVFYTHNSTAFGACDGGSWGNVGSVGAILGPDGTGRACGYGTVWVWRIWFNDNPPNTSPRHYDVVLGTPNLGDVPAAGQVDQEAVGCMWAP